MRIALRYLGIGLFFMLLVVLMSLVQAQVPIPDDLVTEGARSWFIALSIMIFAGVKFVQMAVAFLKVRFGFLQGVVTVYLSLALSIIYVVFCFQPNVLNISGFEALPLWQAYAASILGIWLSASGGKDIEALKIEAVAEAEAELRK